MQKKVQIVFVITFRPLSSGFDFLLMTTQTVLSTFGLRSHIFIILTKT